MYLAQLVKSQKKNICSHGEVLSVPDGDWKRLDLTKRHLTPEQPY